MLPKRTCDGIGESAGVDDRVGPIGDENSLFAGEGWD